MQLQTTNFSRHSDYLEPTEKTQYSRGLSTESIGTLLKCYYTSLHRTNRQHITWRARAPRSGVPAAAGCEWLELLYDNPFERQRCNKIFLQELLLQKPATVFSKAIYRNEMLYKIYIKFGSSNGSAGYYEPS